MTRAAIILGCILLLGVVLFGAGRFTAAELTEQLREEYVRNAEFLGQERALALLDRAIGPPKKEALAKRVAPPSPRKPNAMSKALGRANAAIKPMAALSDMTANLDAIARLALFRTSCLFASLPMLMLFVVAAMIDGMVRRTVKAHEFSQYDPEVVALSLVGMLLLLFLMICLVVWPYALPPLLLPGLMLPLALVLNRAAANYRA